MRLTIIRETNTVAVDGLAFEVDCSALPADVHAVQWSDAHGEIEYSLTRCAHCGARSKKGNETILDVTPYVDFVHRWEAARVAAENKIVEMQAAQRAEAEKIANAAGPKG